MIHIRPALPYIQLSVAALVISGLELVHQPRTVYVHWSAAWPLILSILIFFSSALTALGLVLHHRSRINRMAPGEFIDSILGQYGSRIELTLQDMHSHAPNMGLERCAFAIAQLIADGRVRQDLVILSSPGKGRVLGRYQKLEDIPNEIFDQFIGASVHVDVPMIQVRFRCGVDIDTPPANRVAWSSKQGRR